MTHRPNPDVPAVDWSFQPAKRVEGSVYIEMWKIKRGDAVPARATRSPTRAVLHRLGHAAGIAIAAMGLAGCGAAESPRPKRFECVDRLTQETYRFSADDAEAAGLLSSYISVKDDEGYIRRINGENEKCRQIAPVARNHWE